MKVNVRLFASIRELAGTKEERLDLTEGSSVKKLLEILCKRFGLEFARYVTDLDSGLPRSQIQILVNGKSLASLKGVDTELTDGAEVALMPPVGGG
ncbi:MAG: ubiquitin-like small modifier protein 1 [archaeon]